MKPDVIIVLGEWVNSDGSLSTNDKLRVSEAVKLYKNKISKNLVFTGRWDLFIPYKPIRTEAEAMKDYAVKLGVTRENILIETYALDTIGNAYFTKHKFLDKNNWKNLFIITSDYHAQRAEYIFKSVLDKNYKMKFIKAKSNYSNQEFKKIMNKEAVSFKINRFLIFLSRFFGLYILMKFELLINRIYILIRTF